VPRRSAIALKFFLTYFVITAAALAFTGAAGYIQFRRFAIEEADRQLLRHARLLAEAVQPLLATSPPEASRVASEVDRFGKALDLRMTVILPDGSVIADSSVGAAGVAGMENHGDREEVQAALAGRDGHASRRSMTEKIDEHYVAVPIRSDNRVEGAARVSLRIAGLENALARIRNITLGAGAGAFLFMLAGTAIRARKVTGPIDLMRKALAELAAGNLEKRVSIDTGDELEEMADGLNAMADRLEQTIRQLDAGKARLATLVENLSEGVLVIARDRSFRMVNREAAGLLGATGELEGRPYTDVIRHPELLAAIEALGREEPIPYRDVAFPDRSGKIRTLRLAGTRIRFRDEDSSDLLLTLRDITEEKRLAKVKSEFVSNASHELRTPLTNIRGYLEAVQDAIAAGQPADPAFLATAHANTIRMEQLVGDLLELSRAESGEIPLLIEESALDAFLERVVSPLRPAAGQAGVRLTVSGGSDLLRADLRRLSVALSNLVENAIKYGKRDGAVTVTGAADDAGYRFEVADDGPGIPPEHLPRIFERFYRVEKGRSRDRGGTGLGLSIVRHIVESQGGTVVAESAPGAGARFTIRIPKG
jgi:two-component system phosphate regulon sensor histidine kinase PhoR